MRPKREQRERFALLKRIVKISLTASIVLFLAVFFAFVPFRLMLPAYRVPKRGEGELRLHFLGLGGGVTVVEFPDGEVLVVGAGDGSFAGDNVLCRYLRALDMTSLSVVATSSSTLHIGGMPALFEVFDIKTAYLPAMPAETGAYGRFLSAVQSEHCKAERLARYGVIANSSGAYAVCLSPYSSEDEDVTAAECSAVLYLTYEGVGIVLSGDITQKRENMLVREYTLSSDIFDEGQFQVRLENTQILLASSHGSDGGLSAGWLSLLHPSTSVICCNQDLRPSDSAIKRINGYSDNVYRTDELGALMITVKNGGYETVPIGLR